MAAGWCTPAWRVIGNSCQTRCMLCCMLRCHSSLPAQPYSVRVTQARELHARLVNSMQLMSHEQSFLVTTRIAAPHLLIDKLYVTVLASVQEKYSLAVCLPIERVMNVQSTSLRLARFLTP
jgi:hypothetical protein